MSLCRSHCSFFLHFWPQVIDSKSTKTRPPTPEGVSNPSPVSRTGIVRVDFIDPIAQSFVSILVSIYSFSRQATTLTNYTGLEAWDLTLQARTAPVLGRAVHPTLMAVIGD